MGFSGPTALVCGPFSEATLERAIGLIARYSRDPSAESLVRWWAGELAGERTLGAEVVRAAAARLPQRHAAFVALSSLEAVAAPDAVGTRPSG